MGEFLRVLSRRLRRNTTGDSWFNCQKLRLAGDGAGRVDDAAVRAAERHLPHQQRRVHHRGGDPRRPVQRDQELGGRDYTGLVDDAIHNSDGSCWTKKVRTEGELREAIATATGAKKDCLCFIEVIVHKDDTSKELLEWGSRVSAANSRPPNPQ